MNGSFWSFDVTRLAVLDWAVLAGAVGLLFAIAYLAGRRERDTHDYFLGGRRVPTIIACLSFVATEISAATLVGVPARGYAEDWRYLQFFIGFSLAKVLVAVLFIPVFFKFNCTSIYQFLRHRFGPATQYAGSVFFFITRLLGAGLRLYAAGLAISGILGWSLGQTLIVFMLVTIAFIGFGGIKAVVWNGAYLSGVYFLVGVGVAVYLLTHLGGSWERLWQTASEAGRLQLFDFRGNFTDARTFWGAIAYSFFVGMAIFGTDQELVQRLLTVKTRRASQKAIVGTMLGVFPIVVTYLLMGTLLFLYYGQNPQLAPPGKADPILPHFVANVLPAGLKGLVLAAVVLASIDLPLSSLASSFVSDIYRPLIRRQASERHYLWVSRVCVVAFGVALASIAFASQMVEAVLWKALEVMSIPAGSMLGVFLLGVLTRRRANRGNVVAMVASAAFTTCLSLLVSFRDVLAKWVAGTGWGWLTATWTAVLKPVSQIGWTWLIVIGTISTFALAYVLGSNPEPDGRNSLENKV